MGEVPQNKQTKQPNNWRRCVQHWKSVTRYECDTGSVWWRQSIPGLMSLSQARHLQPNINLFLYFCSAKNWIVCQQRSHGLSVFTHLGIKVPKQKLEFWYNVSYLAFHSQNLKACFLYNKNKRKSPWPFRYFWRALWMKSVIQVIELVDYNSLHIRLLLTF